MANNVKTKDATQKTNGLAIAGFVCSFFVQIVGLVLSIIGLSQINKTGEGGKGLAIAGIIISAAGIILTIIAIFAAVFFSAWLVQSINEYNWRDVDCSYQHDYQRGVDSARRFELDITCTE